MVRAAITEASRIPTPLGGLALGIASLGWCLENVFPLGGLGQLAGAAAAAILLLLLVAKFILHPSRLGEDLAHPVAGSVLPTFAMAAMVISRCVGLGLPEVGRIIWLIAVGLHLTLLAAFIGRRLLDPQFKQMVPSWFIPPVGIVTAALTVPDGMSGDSFHALAYGLMTFGVLSYFLLLPPMVYRMIFHHHEIVDAAKPTIAILAAPASLSLAGYLSVESDPSVVLCAALLGIALLMTAVIYLTLVRLLRLPFSPAYASFTFPLVIGATALFKASEFFAAFPGHEEFAGIVRLLAAGELTVAILVVGFVCALYLRSGICALSISERASERKSNVLVKL